MAQRSKIHALAAVAGLTVLAWSPASVAASVADGAKLFSARCAVCHGADAGGGAGPSLKGVFGRKAGIGGGGKAFTYSPALKASGLTLDAAGLDAFLTAPQKAVPGARMFVPTVQAADRQNLIAYLKGQKP